MRKWVKSPSRIFVMDLYGRNSDILLTGLLGMLGG